MRLLFTIVVVSLTVLLCSARPAEEDYEYDDAPVEPAPTPSTKAPGRHTPLNSRTARGPSPLIGSRGKTTAAPPKPVEPEVVNEPEAVEEEGEGEEGVAPATTTEAPKKGLSRGVVRPFRSNQDLLAALKRKRQQEHTAGGVSTHPPAPTTAAPSESKTTNKGTSRSNSNNNSSSGRRTFNRNSKTTPAAAEVTSAEEQEAPKKPSFPSSRRFSSGRGKPAAPAPVNEDPEGDEEEFAPRTSKTFRGGRRI